MDAYAQQLAARILEESILAQAKERIPGIATSIIEKFDKGPKPDKDMSAGIRLELQISAKLLYEIEAKVHANLGGGSDNGDSV